MSKMYFSDLVLTHAAHGAARRGATGNGKTKLSDPTPVALSATGSCVTFWKGTIPTNEEMNGFINSSRTADALLRFTGASKIGVSGKNVVADFGTATFGEVLATGTATWFNFGNTDTNVNRPLLFGTVGLAGSGADLILPKVSIVVNDLWLCTNLYFATSNEATFA